jgi:hypothetical protein
MPQYRCEQSNLPVFLLAPVLSFCLKGQNGLEMTANGKNAGRCRTDTISYI